MKISQTVPDLNALKAARAQAAKLAHDVGKYISRMARNLGDGDIPQPVAVLLFKDLFAIDGKNTAANVFETYAAALEAIMKDSRLTECRIKLKEIDSLKGSIANEDTAAMRKAATLALEIEESLNDICRDIGSAIENFRL